MTDEVKKFLNNTVLEKPNFVSHKGLLDDTVQTAVVKNKIHLRSRGKEYLYLYRAELGRGLYNVDNMGLKSKLKTKYDTHILEDKYSEGYKININQESDLEKDNEGLNLRNK
ncbi:hypothetical protein CWI36_0004p0020 [Hamiltosporidium magnivora]|uniref:Uncharacterized protein n=1 Tax=Hamiltosporidium magnivora TaxID=148818 RepID=A0A4Q9LMY1_9MICR|nr:hypothetical protein CWI36_0005p0020 [Hamiltosporidium magnivora]TBU09728.1 hypothetical protein CWI36_0004p0020 [Hamiltosporidium magnivora]